jgi:hypothetical protein
MSNDAPALNTVSIEALADVCGGNPGYQPVPKYSGEYHFEKGDCMWNVVQQSLANRNVAFNSTDIANEVNRLAKSNHIDKDHVQVGQLLTFTPPSP